MHVDAPLTGPAMIDPKQTAPENQALIQKAGNLAVLCLRGGRADMALTLVKFQHITQRWPFEVGDPMIQGVQEEMEWNLHAWDNWARESKYLGN